LVVISAYNALIDMRIGGDAFGHDAVNLSLTRLRQPATPANVGTARIIATVPAHYAATRPFFPASNFAVSAAKHGSQIVCEYMPLSGFGWHHGQITGMVEWRASV
jgi:hypothetical protein